MRALSFPAAFSSCEIFIVFARVERFRGFDRTRERAEILHFAVFVDFGLELATLL